MYQSDSDDDEPEEVRPHADEETEPEPSAPVNDSESADDVELEPVPEEPPIDFSSQGNDLQDVDAFIDAEAERKAEGKHSGGGIGDYTEPESGLATRPKRTRYPSAGALQNIPDKDTPPSPLPSVAEADDSDPDSDSGGVVHQVDTDEVKRNFAEFTNKPEPTSYRAAMNTDERKEWHGACVEEMTSLAENETWILVPRPKGVRVVKGRWVLKRKLGPDGIVALQGALRRRGLCTRP